MTTRSTSRNMSRLNHKTFGPKRHFWINVQRMKQQQQQVLQHRFSRVLVAFSLAPTLAFAQQAPDAGTILREQPRPPSQPAAIPAAPPVAQPAPGPASEGPRVLVKSIRIKGNTLIPEAQLLARLQDLIGKEVSLGELQNAALGLTGFYAERGYLARVFLPPQQVTGGLVEFQVVEGTRGSLNIERQGDRIDAARVSRFIEQRLPAGAPMDIAALGEALNILNEQPGVEATTALVTGKGESDVDLNVAAAGRPPVATNLGLNNQGTRATGALQGSAVVSLANPSGRFDAASLLVNKSEGTTYGRADYSIALGDRGLRLGVNGSLLKYRLVQESFAALQASGTADTVGVNASYPLARRTAFGLTLTGSIETKKLVDRTAAGETSNRLVRVASVGANGYTLLNPDTIDGVLSFGAAVSTGDTDQRNAAALVVDQAARQTQGGFTKLAWNAGLLRPFDANWTFTGTARGQRPSKNLDSSERFSLGGPSGVRAYPASEGTGDAGWLVNLALVRRVGEQLRLGAFVDSGHITVNHTLPAGTTTPNRYSLAAAGLSLDWQPFAQSLLSLLVATPIGGNAGSTTGLNTDGSRTNRPRVWLSFSALL